MHFTAIAAAPMASRRCRGNAACPTFTCFRIAKRILALLTIDPDTMIFDKVIVTVLKFFRDGTDTNGVPTDMMLSVHRDEVAGVLQWARATKEYHDVPLHEFIREGARRFDIKFPDLSYHLTLESTEAQLGVACQPITSPIAT